MKKPDEKETEKDRIDRLEYSLANAHLAIKRLQDHLHSLEHDKTILVAEIQKVHREPIYIPYSVPSVQPWIPSDPEPFPQWRITCQH